MRRLPLLHGAAALLACVAPLQAQPSSTPAESQRPAPQRLVVPNQAVAVLGAAVTAEGKAVGRLVDVLVNEAGAPEAAVLDCGGFMGMGSRRVAVAWTALHFAPAAAAGQVVTVDLTPDEVRSAPEYRDSKPAAVVTPPAAPPPPPPSSLPSSPPSSPQ